MKIIRSLLAAFILIPVGFVTAGPLTEAHVTKIVNDVKLNDPATGDRAAKLDDVVRDEIALTTGIKSRSELLFQDNTLTRLGPESYFSFKAGTRDLTLQKGTLLLQVPKGLGGAKIHTAAVTAAITGTTIMMEYVPQKEIKVLVLEGTLRLSMNGKFGDSLLLTPGKMVIMSPSARRIPDPVTVDLKKLVQTSSLVNMHGKDSKQASADTSSLPSMGLIQTEIDKQQTGKDGHRLLDTNLVILGKGTTVVMASDDLMDDLQKRTDLDKIDLVSNTLTPSLPAPTPAPTPIQAPTPNLNPPPSGTPTPPPPVSYTVDGTTSINKSNSGPSITTQGATNSGVIYNNVPTNGSPAAFLFGGASSFDNELNFDNDFLQDIGSSAVFTFDSLQLSGGISFVGDAGPNSVVLIGENGITNIAGSVDLSGISNILFATKSGSIVLDSGLTFNSSADGSKPNFVEFYARGGDVNVSSTFNLSHSTLEFAAENNAIFSGGMVTAKNLDVTSLQTIHFDTNASVSQLFQLNGGDVELGSTVTAQSGFIYGSLATINGSLQAQNLGANVTGDFLLTNSGSLSTTGPATATITTGGNITLDGTVNVQNLALNAGGVLNLNGSLTTSNQLNATAGSALLTGVLNAQQATFQTTGDFVLTGSLTATGGGGGVQITSTGGGVTVNGLITSPQNVTLTASGLITIGHSITANKISITGGSVAFTTDFAVPAASAELTASGSINATGHSLSGFDQILLNGGGTMTVGSVNAKTITINGTLAGGSITADNITTNALQADSVTANKSLTINGSSLAPYVTNTLSINTPQLTLVAGANLNGTNGTPLLAPTNAFNLAINTGSYTLGTNINLNGGDADPSRNDAGGNGGQLDLTSSGPLTINAPISATTGLNSKNNIIGGAGGTVNLNSNNTITVNNNIQVSSNDGARRRSASGGHININSTATGGTAISVSSSAQLLALLDAAAPGPGGSIKFTSAGGAINMNGTAQADRGSIEITNNGSGPGSQVNLTNATLMADTIKVGALASNGTLNIGGGIINADTMIKLYAGGSSGTVDFVDNVTLSGSSAKIIAASTVIINNGKIVTILGPAAADVYTNFPHYTGFGGDGTTTGTFAGKGAVTHPFSGAPGY